MRISDWTSDVCSSDLKGANHCPGNIFIYAPAQKVLTKIDIVSPGTTPFFHCDASENISGYIDAHRRILEYDFDYLVGGHVRRWGTRAAVDTALEYFQDMVNFRSEERRVGKECVSTCRSRWSPFISKKKSNIKHEG